MVRTAITLAALAALATAVLLGQAAFLLMPAQTQQAQDNAALIAVEYDTQRTLSLTAAFSRGRMLLDIDHDGTTPLTLLVPADWIRTETRGAPLADVPIDPPRLGMQRLVLPPQTGVQFAAREPAGLAVNTPSSAPLTIRLTRIDLASSTVDHDATLVQEGRVRVW